MSTVSTTTIDPAVASLNAARTGVQYIGQPLLFSFGIIGCLLNILIFIRPSMRQNSCAIYFHGSSWANLFCLTWGVLASMLATFTNNNPALYNIVYCKIRFYMISFSQMSSRACVVLACLDRLLLCSRSVRKRSFCRPSVAVKVMFITIFLCACLPIYVLVTYEPQTRLRQCTSTSETIRIIEIVNLWLLTFGAPTLLMSVLSTLTLWKLKQNAKRMGREKIQVRTRDIQLAAMLLGQVFLYMITALPFATNALYLTLTQNDPVSSKTPYRIAAEAFSQTLTSSFGIYVFNGLSFYVYTLTAPSFRRELLIVLLPRRWVLKLQQNEQRQTFLTNRVAPSLLATASIQMQVMPRRISNTYNHDKHN